jgi:hypothetical protein
MLLIEHARRIIHALQVRHGKCFATERAKRVMVAEKRAGVVPGERSIYRVEKQLEARGELERKLIWPGDRMPNGDRASKHLVLVRLITRQERRAKAKQLAKRERQAEMKQRERAQKVPAVPAAPAPRVAVDETSTPASVAGTPAAGPRSVLEAIARAALGTVTDDPERLKLERERQLAALAAFSETTSSPGEDKPPDE